MSGVTAAEIAEAFCSLQGVSNVVVQVGSIEGKAPKQPQKVTPIKSLHEFVFSQTTVQIKLVSRIGQGKTINLDRSKFKFDSKYDYKIMDDHQLDQRGKPKRFTFNPMPGSVELQKDVAESSDQVVFDCKKDEDCHAEFSSIDDLKIHQDGGCYGKELLPTGGETMHILSKRSILLKWVSLDRLISTMNQLKDHFITWRLSEINLPEKFSRFYKETRWSHWTQLLLEHLEWALLCQWVPIKIKYIQMQEPLLR